MERVTGQNCKLRLESLVFGNDDTDTHTPVRALAQTHKYAHSHTDQKGVNVNRRSHTLACADTDITQDMTFKNRKNKRRASRNAHDRDELDTVFCPEQDGCKTAGTGVVHSQKQHRGRESEGRSLKNVTKLNHHSTTTTAGTI